MTHPAENHNDETPVSDAPAATMPADENNPPEPQNQPADAWQQASAAVAATVPSPTPEALAVPLRQLEALEKNFERQAEDTLDVHPAFVTDKDFTCTIGYNLLKRTGNTKLDEIGTMLKDIRLAAGKLLNAAPKILQAFKDQADEPTPADIDIAEPALSVIGTGALPSSVTLKVASPPSTELAIDWQME